ncbi:MAG: diaminopimelate decarboxylase [Candidatus Nanopelagicales bacterium]|jgi:diaminopimelate decarboxylase|nr:diaminopimelate decarboxylase [Candidatus Nanopelagicales bacterium]
MRAHPAGPLHGDGLPQPSLPPPPDPTAMARVDAQIWPATARRDPEGRLVLGGLPVTDLVARHGTPVLLLDEADFRARAAAFQSAYTDATVPGTVSYAGKAFLSGTTVRWLAEEGLGLDVCTGGELALATAAGFPAERITLHGNNKSDAELQAALAVGVGRFVVDALDEVTRLATLAAAAGVVADVLVRVTTGVEAHTHEFIATAHEDQKFGLSLTSGAAREAVLAVVARPELRLLGIHSHIGSQIFSTAGFEVAAHRVVGFIAELAARDGVVVEELNLGGGMGIAYLPGDDPVAPVAMADALRMIVAGECQRRALPVPRIGVEPGRAIVGPSMVTAYEVGTVKPVEYRTGAWRTYVSVDGGMSDNIRTALYDAEYTVALANRVSGAPAMLSRIVGKHCESGDVVVRDAWLPSDLARGDLLAVAATGAYCRAMASNYNLLTRPPVVSVRAGVERVVLRRETQADLFALDPALADVPAASHA